MKIIIWAVGIAAGVYFSLLIYLYFNQKSMVFFPNWNFVTTPDQLGMTFEDITLNPYDEETIHGWFFPSESDTVSNQKRVVLFCHGNAGNISYRLPSAQALHEIGVDVFMFDYRGYGHSLGEPSEESVYEDARICFDWLIESKGYKSEEIVILGRSIGGAVGVELARHVDCKALIIESSFTSAGKMGQKLFPFFPVDKILRFKFNSLEKIASINCPLLIVHSQDDEIIPYEMGVELFEKAVEPKRLLKIFGGHNELLYLSDSGYVQSMKNIIF